MAASNGSRTNVAHSKKLVAIEQQTIDGVTETVVMEQQVARGVKPDGSTGPLPLTADGKLDISAALEFTGDVSATPTGAAGTPNAAVVSVQGIPDMTPIAMSAAALPLPTGAAAEAGGNLAAAATVLGATGDAAVETDANGTISGKLRGLVKLVLAGVKILGVAKGTTAAASPTVSSGGDDHNCLDVNIVSGGTGGGAMTVADGADVTQGDVDDAAVDTDTTGTLSGKLRGVVKILVALTAKIPVLGQALAASSVPVVLPAAQVTTLTPPAAITGFATSTKQSDGSQKTQVVDAGGTIWPTPAVDPAHGAADDATGPARIGGKASAAAPAAVDEGDRVNAWFDLYGRLHAMIEAVIPGTAATNLGKAEDGAHTSGDVGVMALGVRKDSTGALAPDGDYAPLQVGASGDLKVGGYGVTGYRNLDVDESEDEIKATAGRVAWIHYSNLHATAARYLKFYNATAANVTVGTTAPQHTFRLRGDTDGTIEIPEGGLIFDTAITVAATTALADNDTGAPGANEVVVNIGYK